MVTKMQDESIHDHTIIKENKYRKQGKEWYELNKKELIAEMKETGIDLGELMKEVSR